MNQLSDYLSEFTKGIIYLIFGFVLFLYATGLLTKYIDFVVIFGSIIIMVYGFMKANLHRKLMDLMTTKKPQQ